ncbi:MAG: hypothetical protein GX675_01220 [Erysipelotrichaceae bacterium]|nr:hypothetical protein [Erysipelotrichaceae bacterium]
MKKLELKQKQQAIKKHLIKAKRNKFYFLEIFKYENLSFDTEVDLGRIYQEYISIINSYEQILARLERVIDEK